jgi:hypothetical protein
MRRSLAVACCALLVYLCILGPFTKAATQKTYVEKLGLIPHPKLLQTFCFDFQEFLGASIVGKVVLYYGSMIDSLGHPGKVLHVADYPAMSRTIHAALKLDPYNMDGYYFGQSILTWDVGQYRLASELLEYGMQYRTWDWQLPFFAGFNYAYFLKDKNKAAEMYMRAGEISGAPLFRSLAGRYLQEAGQTRMAIDYLQTLLTKAKNDAVKSSLQIRIEAFSQVLKIENARDSFLLENKELPNNVAELINSGYLVGVPVDPYGGRFFFDSNGQVRSTSKFAFTQSPD